MLHVEVLSRQIFVVEDNSFDRNFALCQNDNPVIKKIREELEQADSKNFEMRNGLVYKKTAAANFILRSSGIRDKHYSKIS